MSIKIHSLVRSKRKSISLQITADATLVVRAPLRVSESYIERLIQEKQDWILKKLAEVQKRKEQKRVRICTEGERFLFLGEEYPLKISHEAKGLRFADDEFLMTANTLSPKTLFLDWYKKAALEVISTRVQEYASELGWNYGQIKISTAKKRWGSCSYSGNLNFSWRLIMAPLEVLDYVVVHELVHLKHKDHSSRFWNKVAEICPDYKEQRRWLKENGALLEV